MINANISSQLESLRGLSAIIVLFAHAYQIFINPIFDSFYNIISLIAQSAVMIFFVLSGFLISLSIQNNINKNTLFSFKKFITNRFNRIYVPLLFSVFIVVLLSILSSYFFQSNSNQFISQNLSLARSGFSLNFKEVIAALTFTNGFLADTVNVNPPLWSLAYEFWYYVLAGLIALNTKISKLFALILFFILSIFSKTFLLLSIVWFSGFLIQYIINKNLTNKTQLFSRLLIIPTLFLAFIYVFKIQIPIIDNRLILVLFQICFGLIFCNYLIRIVLEKKHFSCLFKKSSSYSYTLYILHFPFFLFIFGLFEMQIVNNLIIALIIALISSALLIFSSKLLAKKIEHINIINLNHGIKTHVAAPPPVGGERA